MTFHPQLNGAFGFKLNWPHISSFPWDFRACWTGLKISKFQCLLGALRSQTRDCLVTPQCISGWISLPKTKLFQSDLWDVKPGRPTCRLRVRWRNERVMEAVSCFLRNKRSCPLQPREGRDADKGKQSRCLTAVLYRVLKTGVRLHRVKGYRKKKKQCTFKNMLSSWKGQTCRCTSVVRAVFPVALIESFCR